MHRRPAEWVKRSTAGRLENYKIAFCILSHNTTLTWRESPFVFDNCSHLANNKNMNWGAGSCVSKFKYMLLKVFFTSII